MSTEMTCVQNSNSFADTEHLGARLAQNLKGGEVIELVSDLGGGKTTFTRGLARGARSENHVSSPSFVIRQTYQSPKFLIHHFDFHRLNDPGIAAHELSEVLDDPNSVTIIEWADRIRDVLPGKILTIKITPTGENNRRFEFSCPQELAYTLEGIC